MINWFVDEQETITRTVNSIFEELRYLTDENSKEDSANHWIDNTHNVFAVVNDNGDGDKWIEIHLELYNFKEDIIGDLIVLDTEDDSLSSLYRCIKKIVREYYRE